MKKYILLLTTFVMLLGANDTCQDNLERIIESKSLLQLKLIEAKRSHNRDAIIQVMIIGAELANNMNNRFIPSYKSVCTTHYQNHKDSVDEATRYFKNLDDGMKDELAQNKTIKKENTYNEHLLKECNAGNAKKCGLLAFAYHQGDDIEQNYALAEQYYKKAIQLGDVDSYSTLAHLYHIMGKNDFKVSQLLEKCVKFSTTKKLRNSCRDLLMHMD